MLSFAYWTFLRQWERSCVKSIALAKFDWKSRFSSRDSDAKSETVTKDRARTKAYSLQPNGRTPKRTNLSWLCPVRYTAGTRSLSLTKKYHRVVFPFALRVAFTSRDNDKATRATAHDPISQRYNETTAADEIGYDDMREQTDKAKKNRKKRKTHTTLLPHCITVKDLIR